MALVELSVADIQSVSHLATDKSPLDEAIRLSAAQNAGGAVTVPEALRDRVADLKRKLPPEPVDPSS